MKKSHKKEVIHRRKQNLFQVLIYISSSTPHYYNMKSSHRIMMIRDGIFDEFPTFVGLSEQIIKETDSGK
jgi:hypothetical protein